MVGLALHYAVTDFRPSTCAILGWDATCASFLGLMMIGLFGESPQGIRAHAATQDEGRGFILALVTIAASVSIGARSVARGAIGPT